MLKFTKVVAVLAAILIPLGAVASAQAAGEKVAAKTKIVPKAGKFKKKTRLPARLSVSAVVTPSATSAEVTPTKRIQIKFPAGMSLVPDRRVCSDKKLNASSSLSSPKTVVANCASSVVGTGTAVLYLAKVKASLLKDPILVVFNAGKTRKGQAKLKIYGFSKQTGVGVLMTAVLKGRVLNISIPVLSFDSSVGEFKIQLPGPRLNRPEIGVNTKGKNGRYVRASCPRSPLVTTAVFSMGTRNPSTGQATSPTTNVKSKKSTQKCRARGR